MTTPGSSNQSPGAASTQGREETSENAPASKDGNDWTEQVTELVTDTVERVRSRTTGPLMGIAHGLVYAIVGLIVAVPVMILLFAGLIRLVNWAIPGDIWIIYALIAVLGWIAGALLWARRGTAEST